VDIDSEGAVSNSELAADDDEPKSRAKRHSLRPYAGRSSSDPKKLGFYPAQWREVLDKGRTQFFRPWMAIECGFPTRAEDRHVAKAMECVTDSISEHQKNGGKVEQGIYLAN
jgi:hypothetical protein